LTQARAELAAERLRQAQLRAALETLRVGFETRQAYYRAIGAQELAASRQPHPPPSSPRNWAKPAP